MILQDAFMVIGTKNSNTLNFFVFFLRIAGVLIAPGMAYPKSTAEKVGKGFFGLSTLISLNLIFYFGTEYGGAKTTTFLALNKASSTIGVIVTPPNK